MKKKKNTQKFPNNYRIITENHIVKMTKNLLIRLPNQSKLGKFIYFFLIADFLILMLVLIFVSGILTSRAYKNLTFLSETTAQRQELKRQKNFWQSVLQKYPGYKDAYFRIALLEYKLGDFEKAKKDNMDALLLDPNYEDAINLQTLIKQKGY